MRSQQTTIVHGYNQILRTCCFHSIRVESMAMQHIMPRMPSHVMHATPHLVPPPPPHQRWDHSGARPSAVLAMKYKHIREGISIPHQTKRKKM